MREGLLGMLEGWSKLAAAYPVYTAAGGVAIVLALLASLHIAAAARLHARTRVGSGPLVLAAGVAALIACAVWALADAVMWWRDAPLVSERLLAALIPDSPAAVDVSAARTALGLPEGGARLLLSPAITMPLGLLAAGLLQLVIVWLAGGALAEMIALELRPDDVIARERERRRGRRRELAKRARAARDRRERAEAEQAPDAAGDAGGDAVSGARTDAPTAGAVAPGAGAAGAADDAGVPGDGADAGESTADAPDDSPDESEAVVDPLDEELDASARAGLGQDRFGRIYRLFGHFSDYREAEQRYRRWLGQPIATTLYTVMTLGAVIAGLGSMPIPVWVGAAILSLSVWLALRAPGDAPADRAAGDAAGDATGDDRAEDGGQARGQVRGSFAGRTDIAPYLSRAPRASRPPARPVPALPDGMSRAFVRDILAALDIARLWPHQAAALAAFGGRGSVLLATPPGSGRQLAVDVMTLYALLADAERVLYLAPDAARARRAREVFAARAEATHWKWNVLSLDIASPGDAAGAGAGAIDPERAEPALVFSDPEAAHRRLCGEPGRWQGFLAGLGLIVIPDLTPTSGVAAAHLSHIVRRLVVASRRARMVARGRAAPAHAGADDRVRFAITADPHPNLRRFAERVIGRPVALYGVDWDGAPRPRQDVGVVSPGAALPGGADDDAAHPALVLRDRARARGYAAELHGYDDVIPTSERDVRAGAEADVFIARLWPGSIAGLPGQAVHLGREAGAGARGPRAVAVSVLWQPDPTPAAALLAESASSRGRGLPGIARGSALIAAPDAPAVARGHLLCALVEGEPSLDELLREFPRRVLADELAALRARGELRDRTRRVLDPARGVIRALHTVALAAARAPHNELSLATCGDAHALIERSTGDALVALEAGRSLAAAYPGRVLVARGRRVRVLPADAQDQLGEGRVLCEQTDERLVTVAMRTLAVAAHERREADRDRRGSGSDRRGPGNDHRESDRDQRESGDGPAPDGQRREPDRDAREPDRRESESDRRGSDGDRRDRARDRREGGLLSLGGEPFALHHRDVSVVETVHGLYRFGVRGELRDTIYYDRPVQCRYQTRAALLGFPNATGVSDDAAATIAHAFRELLPAVVVHREEDLAVAGDVLTAGGRPVPTVAFVDLHPGGAGFAEAITLEGIRVLARAGLALLARGPVAVEATRDLDQAGAARVLAAILGEPAP